LIIEAQRRGLHGNAYNTYPSIILGWHTILTIRTGPERVTNFGDCIDLLIPPRTRSTGI
jgi:2-oxoglutarate/2-oxoacid ferredoxin oxidoreductase subunit alpha